jgi:hypothetical protein
LGVGFGAFVGGPLAALLLGLTVLGVALALIVVVVYALALVGGFLIGALFLGTFAMRRFRGGPATGLGQWIAALAAGLVVVGLACLVPVLGPMVGFAVLLLGLGALMLHAHRGWRAWRGSSGALAAAA